MSRYAPVGMAVLVCSSAVLSEPLHLVKDGKAQAVIVAEKTEGKAGWPLRAAVGELQKYIRQIAGCNLRTQQDGTAVNGTAIHVGRTEYVKGLKLGLEELDKEGVLLKRVGDRVVLVGGSHLGTRHAVRIFLEEVCGVRQYLPGDLWKIVPKAKDIRVEQLDRKESPSYLNRYTSGVLHERWMEWNRASWPERYWIGHNIGKVIDPDVYGKEHPEYFPLIGGKRNVPHAKSRHKYANWQPCLSNPAVAKIAVEAARKYFDERPDDECFSLAQNDNYGWCQCDKCISMNGGLKYDEVGHICFSDLFFRFLNQVCAELEKTHPGKKIGTMAYQCGTYAPPSVKVHPNIIILIVNDRSRFHFDPKFRKEEKAYLESWAKVAHAFAFHNWHYGTRFLIPRLELKSTQDFLRYAHSIGGVGYHGEEYPNWGLEGPKTWITTKLLWNVNADVDALLQEFCTSYFGDAAASMRRFYDTLEEAWNTQPILDIYVNSLYLWREDRRQLNIVTPCVAERCRGSLKEALGLAKSEIQRKRIEHISKTFRVTEYFVQREATYRAIDVRKHLEPVTFAELVDNLNQMLYAGRAVRKYVGKNILKDLLTFHRGWPGSIPMDIYYCELGSQIASELASRQVAEEKPASQSAMTEALLARFDAMAKVVTDSAAANPLTQGLAWPDFGERVRNYLGAVAFVPRLKKPPVIDGQVGEGEWGRAPNLTGFKIYKKKGTLKDKAKHQTTVLVGYDSKALYVAYVCNEQDVAALTVAHDGHDSSVWQDDSADFTILPAGIQKENFLHYIVNPKGVLYDAKGSGPGSSDWNGKPSIACGKDGQRNAWTLEVAIPWSDFGKQPASGQVWRAQFARINSEGMAQEFSCWAPTSAGFNNADYLGVLLFE